MAKKKNKQVKQKLPKIDMSNTEFFECPHCKSQNFQLKQQLDKAIYVQCVDCGDEWEVEIETCDDECEDCKIK